MLYLLKLASRILYSLDSFMPRRITNSVWEVFVSIMRKRTRNGFVKSVYGSWFIADWKDATFMMAITGRWGFKLFDLLQDKKRDPYTFIDVGANFGTYSLIAASVPHCQQVHAIEANPVVYDCLKKNIEKNGTQINSYMVGVGSSEEKMRLSYKSQHLGIGTLMGKFNEGIEVLIRNHDLFDEILDNSSEKRFFIKIDVEGWEPKVVHQLLQSRITAFICCVFIEVTPHWIGNDGVKYIFEALQGLGLKEVWRSKSSPQYDVLFERTYPIR